MRSWPLLLALAVGGAPVVTAGCGTDAQGVDTCKKIEEARCRAAASCPDIQLTPPYYTNGSAVDACIRYYDVACLHGLEVTNPSGKTVSDCVNAIQGACGDGGACNGASSPGCAIIENPQITPACSWLTPPNTPPPDASADADGGAVSDASDASDAHPDTDVGDAVVQFPDGF